MAGGVNKAIIIGNLGADPELRVTPGGQPVCELRVATNESWTGKDGQKQERTEWHSIVVWGKMGELCKQYLAKGRQVYVEGRLQTRSWEDKETGKKQYKTEIVAQDVRFLGGGAGMGAEEGGAPRGGGRRYGGGGGGGGGSGRPEPPPDGGMPGGDNFPGEDDIPF